MPDQQANSHAGRRPFLTFEATDAYDPPIERVRSRGAVRIWWREGDESVRGWWNRYPGGYASGSGPYDTSAEAYASAIGW